MSVFGGKHSIGVAWDSEGRCRAVLMEGTTGHMAVTKHWLSEDDDDRPVAVLIPEAVNALGGAESTGVIAGATNPNVGLADREIPDLTADNLRNALQFELRRVAPLPPEQLVWGYRILPSSSEQQKKTARIVYMREREWESWLEHVSGLTRSLDLLVPPLAALDPAFSSAAVQTNNEIAFVPGDVGRTFLPAAPEGIASLGKPEDPLTFPGLDTGPLADLPTEERQLFLPAILLAAYGLGDSLSRDRRTLPRLPSELVPRRHRMAKMCTSVLLVYVIGLVLFWAGREFVEASSYRSTLEEAIRSARRSIAELEALRETETLDDRLAESLEAIPRGQPGMGTALVELTEMVPTDYWTSKMTWTAGTLELDIRGESGDVTFLQDLEESPLLREIELTDKKVGSDGRLLLGRISMWVESLDGAGEGPGASRPPPPPAPPEEPEEDREAAPSGEEEEPDP